MKFHKPLVQAVIATLQQIFNEGVYADKAVEQALKQSTRWGSRDRKFIAETVYEMVRWWRLITETSTNSTNYFHYFATWQIIKGNELPDWQEFSEIDKNKIIETTEQLKSIRKFRESIPDWLDELGSKELGEHVWEKELISLNKEAKVVLRVNTLQTSRNQLQRLLEEQLIETTIDTNYSDALILSKRQNLHHLKEYQQGLFEIQDASSQLIAPFLDLSSGMTVIDACAGAGGKSLHIASVMQNKGKIISMDVEERKLKELQKRADRAKTTTIQTQLITTDTINKFKNSADRLLLDVPCSGLGVLRRNPDAKWKLNLGFINEVKKTQQNILINYSQMLKQGGIMVYATCSILPSENQQQVEQFLNENKNTFEFIEDRKILPSEGYDGFYMAKLKRRN